MPELPEVETIRRGLAERLSGQTITGLRVRQAQLRHLVDVAALLELAVGGRSPVWIAAPNTCSCACTQIVCWSCIWE